MREVLFLQRWTKCNNLNNADVIYFDAFQHDYLDEPLLSLGSVISEKVEKKKWDTAFSMMKKVAFPAFRVGLALVTYGATEVAGAAIGAATDTAGDEASKAAEDYWSAEDSRRLAMEGFRSALKAMTNNGTDSSKQLVIIVDELDRCRPDYALSLLEIMKHLFAVPNVHFVLGVNLKELENSVHARYGNGVDAAKYLQRFIQVEMPMQQTDPHETTTASNEVYYFTQLSKSNQQRPEKFNNEMDFLHAIPANEAITFRDMERLFTICRVTQGGGRGNPAEGMLLAGLRVIKACRPSWISDIVSGELSVQKIVSFFDLKSEHAWPRNGLEATSTYPADIWKSSLRFSVNSGRAESLLKELLSGTANSDHPYPALAKVCCRDLTSFTVR
ncbi:P-loop NTPase fold protein [Falsihalocynthiibacter sp. S25ZX9]|uniref:KAP family P-loop NTPase fold protein n=1 Tax=Falsihalocynthiibacter sp. S25ZX9 TaxID=3240870 RepID=UPI00350EEDF5